MLVLIWTLVCDRRYGNMPLLVAASANPTSEAQTSTSSKSVPPDSVLRPTIPVYWINLDKDIERKRLMENHLNNDVKFPYQKRIPALIPTTTNLLMFEQECKRWSLSDVAILASHLKAIYTAIYDDIPNRSPNGANTTTTQSKYALILEDDIRFQYTIDFDALIASAPRNFGVLQLMTSHYDQIVGLWNSYRYRSEIWTYRRQDSSIWSAQAYLINKETFKQYVDVAVLRLQPPQDKHFELAFKIIQTFDGERGKIYTKYAILV
jgi:hypothetical protein